MRSATSTETCRSLADLLAQLRPEVTTDDVVVMEGESMVSMTPVKFHPKGLLVLLLFAAALAFALVPRWGAIAAGGCVLVEFFLLLGMAGFGRDQDGR